MVVAGFAAGLTVHQAVGADADVDHGLAKAAKFLTLALALGLFALGAAVFGGTGSCGHEVTVARGEKVGNVTLVMSYVVCFVARGRFESVGSILCAL